MYLFIFRRLVNFNIVELSVETGIPFIIKLETLPPNPRSSSSSILHYHRYYYTILYMHVYVYSNICVCNTIRNIVCIKDGNTRQVIQIQLKFIHASHVIYFVDLFRIHYKFYFANIHKQIKKERKKKERMKESFRRLHYSQAKIFLFLFLINLSLYIFVLLKGT